MTLHQTGNMREHDHYWYLTEIFNLPRPNPALNGEPYYAGYKDARGPGGANYPRGAPGGSEQDDHFVRSCMYGSFLSGGLAGHVYGAEGIWGVGHRACRADQDVGRVPVALGRADAAPAHVRAVDRQPLPGAGADGRPRVAEQDARHAELRGLGLLRPHAGQEHVPRLLREGRSAGEAPRGASRQPVPRAVVRPARGHLVGRGRAAAPTRSGSSRCRRSPRTPTGGCGSSTPARRRGRSTTERRGASQAEAGAMFLFTRNRFSGSQRVFTSTSRVRLSP